MKDSLSGQCHCGSVKWSVSLPHKLALICHCNMCRVLSGADYSSWLVFPADQFRVIAGEELVNDYQASENFFRFFCSDCGSTVSAINNDKFPDHVYVTKGNITSEFDIPTEIQVFSEYKARWVRIDDDIPVLN